MFSKVTGRIGKAAVAGLVVATIGLGLFGGTGSAYARDNEDTGASVCYHNGVSYSEGAIVRMDNGALYQCKDGAWVFYCAGCATGIKGSAVVTPLRGGGPVLKMAP